MTTAPMPPERQMPPEPTCPECDGAWLGGFDFAHFDGCHIGVGESTRLADDLHELIDRDTFTRLSTEAELTLARFAFGHDTTDPVPYRGQFTPHDRGVSETTTVSYTDRRHRVVAGFTPYD